MTSAPGKWWTVTGFAKEMIRLDWTVPSMDAIRMSARRVVESDAINFKTDKGGRTGATTYSYRPLETEPTREFAGIEIVRGGLIDRAIDAVQAQRKGSEEG